MFHAVTIGDRTRVFNGGGVTNRKPAVLCVLVPWQGRKAGRPTPPTLTPMDDLKVLIAAEHASARFGGEAALALHYFRVLRERGIAVWLLTHSRTRDELNQLFSGDLRIIYVEDTAWQRALWRMGTHLPDQIAYLTTGFLSRISTQLAQRRTARRLVCEQGINVIHQPMPVSPREPSLLFGLGMPVVMGPMNGGMNYPPAFVQKRSLPERLVLVLGRASAPVINFVVPGKRFAALLLVANRRTREALPLGVGRNVAELVENGVDLSLWHATVVSPLALDRAAVTFVFMGRLVAWKAVDVLLHAFSRARNESPMRLWILGDGGEGANLRRIAAELGLADDGPSATGTVHFAGWLPQSASAARLREADCLVLPSLLECGGAVVLEAMALAKPVIATAWGGPLDYLDADCGFLIAPDSRDALIAGFAEAMVAMASSPERRRSMGEHGRAKVQDRYDWEAKVDRMLGLYADARRIYARERPQT